MKKIDCISYNPENVPGNIKTAFMGISIHGNRNPFFMSIETKVCNFFVIDEDMILFEPLFNIKESRDYIWPYIEEYSGGYIEGMNEVNALSDRFYIDGDRRTPNEIYKLTQGKRGYLSNCFRDDDYTMERCYQFGIIAGRFFKSWELILSNPDDFVRFFPEVQQEVKQEGASTTEKTFADLLTCEIENKKQIIEGIQKLSIDKPIDVFYILSALIDHKVILETDKSKIYRAFAAEFSYKKSVASLGSSCNSLFKKRGEGDKSYNNQIEDIESYLFD